MTVKQKQHLLGYLGYYTIAVDGKWGPGSIQATKDFQEDYGLAVDGIWGPKTEKRIKEVIAKDEKPEPKEVDWSKIRHFQAREFACKCGQFCDGAPNVMKRKLVKTADEVREHFGSAAIVSSGLRCQEHNANVGGVEHSRHLCGKAMDFRVKGVSADALLEYVHQRPEIRYAYKIDDNYIHMDIL